MDFFSQTVKTLEGKTLDLKSWQGKVVLVVNTASECGYTPQYAGLQKLHEAWKDKGVVVLGVPSNDFGAQEPGNAKQIADFCTARFGVTFPLLEKQTVKGANKSPLYQFLTKEHGEPQWNFHKFLVGKDGRVRAAFKSGVTPEGKEMAGALEAALKG